MKKSGFVFIALFAMVVPVQAADLAISVGATSSQNLGQQGAGPVGTLQLSMGDSVRLEAGGGYRGIRKIESGQGYQCIGGGRLEGQVVGALYVSGGARFIHANGGLWTKDTADWTVGIGARHVSEFSSGNRRELKLWIAYSRMFYIRNSASQRYGPAAEIGFRYDAGGPTWGIRTEATFSPSWYDQLRSAGFEPQQGYRLVVTFGIIRRM